MSETRYRMGGWPDKDCASLRNFAAFIAKRFGLYYKCTPESLYEGEIESNVELLVAAPETAARLADVEAERDKYKASALKGLKIMKLLELASNEMEKTILRLSNELRLIKSDHRIAAILAIMAAEHKEPSE